MSPPDKDLSLPWRSHETSKQQILCTKLFLTHALLCHMRLLIMSSNWLMKQDVGLWFLWWIFQTPSISLPFILPVFTCLLFSLKECTLWISAFLWMFFFFIWVSLSFCFTHLRWFHSIAPAGPLLCHQQLSCFLDNSWFMRIPIKGSKMVQPIMVLSVHGTEVDTVHSEARLPFDKLLSLIQLLKEFSGKCSMQLRAWRSDWASSHGCTGH